MNCRIKRVGGQLYFKNNVDKNINHWVYREEAKVFSTVFMAKDIIKKYKLKNVEIEKIKK